MLPFTAPKIFWVSTVLGVAGRFRSKQDQCMCLRGQMCSLDHCQSLIIGLCFTQCWTPRKRCTGKKMWSRFSGRKISSPSVNKNRVLARSHLDTANSGWPEKEVQETEESSHSVAKKEGLYELQIWKMKVEDLHFFRFQVYYFSKPQDSLLIQKLSAE